MKTLAVITVIIIVSTLAACIWAIVESKKQDKEVKRFWGEQQ